MGIFNGALKITVGIVAAVVVLALLAGAVFYGYEEFQKSKARPYEVVKEWPFDATENLAMKFVGKTKLVDSRLYGYFRFEGYPPYLKDTSNSSANSHASITVNFKDKDGFTVLEKTILLREFGTMLRKGERAGLSYHYDEYLSADTYARFDHVSLTWTVDTRAPEHDLTNRSTEATAIADHCAPNISRAERLRRLSLHGTLRETGLNSYSAGGKAITFLNNTELLSCQ